jgi:rod shape-determining protein MreC
MVLAVVVVLGLVIGLASKHWEAEGRANPLFAPLRTAIYPLQSGMANTGRRTTDIWRGIFDGQRLQRVNARLQTENAQLKGQNELLLAEAREAERLRNALRFVQKEKQPLLPASVIGFFPSPHQDTLTLGRGTRDGVQVRSVARTPEGLVGQVIESGPVSSDVLLLSDSTARVSATVWKNNKPTQAVGIVQGMGRGEPLRMVNIKREMDIKPGDKVYSNGYGGVVPPDIPVGTITRVEEDKRRFLKWAEVAPFTPPTGSIREVYILP